MNGFAKELRGHNDQETKELYKTFKTELENEFKSVEMDLEFSLASLKALNSLLKTEVSEPVTTESPSENIENLISEITHEREDLEMQDFLKEMNDTHEINDFYEAVMEAYDAIEEADELQEEITTEGVNYDMHKLLKNFKKEFKKLRHDFEQHVKKNEFKEARKNVSDMEKEMDYYYRRVLDLDSSVFETQLGNIIHSIIFVAKEIILFPTTFLTFGLAAQYRESKDNLVQRTHTANTIRDAQKKRLTTSGFNKYKNDILESIDKNKTTLRKLNKIVDKAEEKYKKQESKSVTKESAEYKDKKLTIYEACANGSITIEEREELLAEMESNSVLSDEIARVDNDMLAKEKYDKVVKALYKRCNENEISVEEREELIEKAKKEIFGLKEEPNTNFMDSQESADANLAFKPDNSSAKDNQKIAEKVDKNLQQETDKLTGDMTKQLDKIAKESEEESFI